MKFKLFILILLLSGCYKHTWYGQYTMAYDRTDLMTTADCYRPTDAIKVSDIALPIIYDELQKAGYIKDLPALQKAVKQHTLICLIPKPEPCVFGKIPAVPWKEINGRIVGARKAGCSTEYTAWASIEYPFLCSGEWPDEPGCVTDTSKISSTRWPSTLAHELLNMIVARVASSALPSYDMTGKLIKGYSGPIYETIEPKIQIRFMEKYMSAPTTTKTATEKPATKTEPVGDTVPTGKTEKPQTQSGGRL